MAAQVAMRVCTIVPLLCKSNQLLYPVCRWPNYLVLAAALEDQMAVVDYVSINQACADDKKLQSLISWSVPSRIRFFQHYSKFEGLRPKTTAWIPTPAQQRILRTLLTRPGTEVGESAILPSFTRPKHRVLQGQDSTSEVDFLLIGAIAFDHCLAQLMCRVFTNCSVTAPWLPTDYTGCSSCLLAAHCLF